MARELAPSTLERFARKLEDERTRLMAILEEIDQQREAGRLAESASEHNPDPGNADGGSIALEMEMDVSVEQNAKHLLEKVLHAQDRMEKGLYGICEVTEDPIPVARLEALPYATTTVEAAGRR
ncbi:MAG: TraR/DksA C4-type zinc finger protein [Actinomycetota bacterium]|nr:TraR/DksA C4-type zinc finger protein [Actinomycetota bacterium]